MNSVVRGDRVDGPIFYMSYDTPIYDCPMPAKKVGLPIWSPLNKSGLILSAPPIGKGAPFEKNAKFITLKQGLIDGVPWEETPRYKSVLKKIRNGDVRWGCSTEEQLKERFNVDLPALFKSIEKHGLIPQSRLLSDNQGKDFPLPSRMSAGHEIKVGLNESGDFLFLDGAHRLGIARLLKLTRIPVRVMFVHQMLDQNSLREIIGDTADEFPSTRPPETSDYQRIAGIITDDRVLVAGYHSIRAVRRRNLTVARALKADGKTVLDVGCAEGTASFYFSEKAKRVIAVDHSESKIEIAKNTAQILGKRNVDIYLDDIRNEELFAKIGKVDLAIAWGFLHRITDPFELLYRLSELTDTISLEWRVPILPAMERVSIAVHPYKSATLDPMNTGAFSEQKDAPKEKIEGSAAFWLLTPGAVKVILNRLGFSEFRVLGYGDRFKSERAIVKGAFDERAYQGLKSFKTERVHVLASRNPLSEWLDDDFKTNVTAPKWDFVAQTRIFKQSGIESQSN